MKKCCIVLKSSVIKFVCEAFCDIGQCVNNYEFRLKTQYFKAPSVNLTSLERIIQMTF